MSGAPEACGSQDMVVVCVCPSVTFLHNAQKQGAETCFASNTHTILLKKYWTDFDSKFFLLTYSVMLTSAAFASNPESSEEQISHNALFIIMTVHLYNKSDGVSTEI